LHIDGSWIGPRGSSTSARRSYSIFNVGVPGRRRLGRDQAQAAVDGYRATIIQAFREVADALVGTARRRS
jgi:outer membrane protein TolC